MGTECLSSSFSGSLCLPAKINSYSIWILNLLNNIFTCYIPHISRYTDKDFQFTRQSVLRFSPKFKILLVEYRSQSRALSYYSGEKMKIINSESKSLPFCIAIPVRCRKIEIGRKIAEIWKATKNKSLCKSILQKDEFYTSRYIVTHNINGMYIVQ